MVTFVDYHQPVLASQGCDVLAAGKGLQHRDVDGAPGLRAPTILSPTWPRRSSPLLFAVKMDVDLPLDMDPKVRTDMLAREQAYSHELQRSGKWVHIWASSGSIPT